jgi:hypothetical protein
MFVIVIKINKYYYEGFKDEQLFFKFFHFLRHGLLIIFNSDIISSVTKSETT